MNLKPLISDAWRELCSYYESSEPEPSAGTGNTKTLGQEREVTQYLALCVQRQLRLQGSLLSVHEEFPPSRASTIRLDVAVIDAADWLDLKHVQHDSRQVEVGVEFKWVLKGTHPQFSLPAVEKDCQRLREALEHGWIREAVMTVIARSKDGMHQVAGLQSRFPEILVLAHASVAQ